MGHFSAPKQHRKLDLMPLLKKLNGLANLNITVMVVDLRPEPDLLQARNMLLLMVLLRLSLLLIQPLAKIHNTANRRLSIRRNLNQIQTNIPRKALSLVSLNYPNLIVQMIDQPNRTDTYPFINAEI